MKNTILVAVFIFSSHIVYSQDLKKFHLYHPEDNAKEKIEDAVKQAKSEKKHVFVQIGGNWCIWCARFNDFTKGDKSIDSLINANFVVYHLNYSEEQKNEKLLAKYGFPQRMGFPVFMILDQKGNLLHTQNSGYLEEGKGYSKSKVISFFSDWTVAALDPSQYEQKK